MTGAPTTGGMTGESGVGSTSTLSGVTSSGESGCWLDCPPDLPPEGPCDPYAQDCPEGEKCGVAWPDGDPPFGIAENRCVPVTGDRQPGESCTNLDGVTGADDCAAGVICYYGECVAQCVGTMGNPTCLAENYKCFVGQEFMLDLCFFVCDPLLQNCPDPLEACYSDDRGFACLPDNSGDEGQVNDPCGLVDACDGGFICFPAVQASAACDPQGGCCQPFCKFPDAPCPNPDQVCVQYFDPADLPPGDPWLEIGFCALPQ